MDFTWLSGFIAVGFGKRAFWAAGGGGKQEKLDFEEVVRQCGYE